MFLRASAATNGKDAFFISGTDKKNKKKIKAQNQKRLFRTRIKELRAYRNRVKREWNRQRGESGQRAGQLPSKE